jgi:O-antigen ligase
MFALNKFIPAGKYIAFFLFLAFIYRTFGDMFVMIFSLIMAVILGGLLLQQKLKVRGSAITVYIFLAFGVVNYIVGVSLYELVFPILLPFFPLLLIHYGFTVRKKLPGSGAFFLMVFGYLVTIAGQTVINRGTYENSLLGDQYLFMAFIFFFSIYILLDLGVLSVWKVIMILSLSVLPEIHYIFFLYMKDALLGRLLLERFGSSVGLTANQIACWLDIAFPLALFIAIYDKKPLVKKIFSFAALLYGASVLLTASRGSMVGLPLIPLFVAFQAKLWRTKILVVVVCLTGMGIFGRGVIERTFFPSRPDKISNIGRTELLKAGIRILKKNHFFFGIGIDNYKGEKYLAGFPTAFDTKSCMSTHNGFLEVWLGWGFLGLLGWLGFLGGAILRAARARLPPEVSYLKPALILAVLISLAHALFDSTIAVFPFMIYLLSLIACTSFLGEGKNVLSENYRFPSDTTIKTQYAAY